MKAAFPLADPSIVLLFWALDRLSREGVLETLQHLNRLTSYGVRYRSFTEQYFDSCGIFRDAVIAIIARADLGADIHDRCSFRPGHLPGAHATLFALLR